MTAKITRKYLLKHFVDENTEFWAFFIRGMYSFDDVNYNSFYFIVVLYENELPSNNDTINRTTLYDALGTKISNMLLTLEKNPKKFYDDCNDSVKNYSLLKTKYNIR